MFDAKAKIGNCLAAAAAVLTSLGVTSVSASTLDEINERGYMVVATEDDYKPFEFIEDGKPMGLDHELLALLKEEAPFEIQQQIIPWTGLLAGVSTGKYDVALTAAVVTKERYESLDFTMPITEATYYYVKRTDDDSINGIADLSGKTVGVQQGGASFAALPELEAKLAETGGSLGEVVQYTSFPEAYQDLATGRLDYVVNGIINLTSLTNEQPDRFKLGERVAAEQFAAWAVAKGNDELLDYLNDFMAKIRADGTLYQLQEKWLGTSFPEMPEEVIP